MKKKHNELTGNTDTIKALVASGDITNWGLNRVPESKTTKEHDQLMLTFPSGRVVFIHAIGSDLCCIDSDYLFDDAKPKRLKKGTQVYYDGFAGRADMIEQFGIQESNLTGYEVIYAGYDQEQYEGQAFVILRIGADLFEVNSSHCSCNGLEWIDPEPTTLKALLFRPNVPEAAKNNLKEAFASLISFI
jgi:hypothetical protein